MNHLLQGGGITIDVCEGCKRRVRKYSHYFIKLPKKDYDIAVPICKKCENKDKVFKKIERKYSK